MKAYGYVYKIEQGKSFVYFPAVGIFAAMNYAKCNPKDLFEFDKTEEGYENPKLYKDFVPDYGKIIEKSQNSLKVKMQNSINYTLPLHFFIKSSDEISVGKEVKILKNKQGVIIFAEVLDEVLYDKEIDEEAYPETLSKKLSFKSMKNMFRFNEKIKKSIESVENIYSSYRKIRGDGNCYYRAVAFAYVENLCRASCPASKFIDFIHSSSEQLRPLLKYLFQIKVKLGSASEYCEEVFTNPENDILLIKEIKHKVAEYLKANPDKISPFLTHSLDVEIKNVLEMGREAEGIPVNFIPTILETTIHNVLLDRENIANNELGNPNSSNCIYLCLRTGHYDLLYTYSQDSEDFSKIPSSKSSHLSNLVFSLNSHIKFLYEKLFSLSSLYNIRLGSYFPEAKTKISAFWQEFCVISGKCEEVGKNCEELFSFVSDYCMISELLNLCGFCLKKSCDIKLFCGCLICRDDALMLLEQATNGLFVLNESEGNLPQCIMCQELLTVEDLQKILGKNFAIHEENMKKRMKSVEESTDKQKGVHLCKECQVKRKISEFNSTHMCVCSDCIKTSIQNGHCRHCGKKFSKDYLKSLKLICALCEGEAEDPTIIHQSHIICQNCEKLCLESEKCLECSNPLQEKELAKLSQKYYQSCFTCGKFSKSDLLKQRKCGCLTCNSCFDNSILNNSGCCSVCGQRLAKPMSQCVICLESFTRDDMLTLNCDHYFCSNCLQQHIINSINQGNEAINCPSCKEIIDGFIIHSLVSEQLWDIYNKASIRKCFKLIDCPKCNSYFETQLNTAKCPTCKFHFCIGCKEPVHQGGCDDRKIMKIITELEAKGERVSQCPGCKIPYTKDEGCEHVSCSNPQCGAEFCFTCSCHRSPTLVHGNHYHREDCKFFGKFDGPDQFSDKCEICKKTGQLCKRPKKLKNPRRFQADES